MSTTCHNCFTERDGGKVCPNCGYENNSASAKYPLALPEGAVLAGRYLIGRVLGQGGFGITYLALDQTSGDKVAIKEYFPETLSMRTAGVTTVSLLSDEKREDFAYGSEKFIEEARTLSTLSTVRGITQILGYFEENDTSYFAMEYIEGMSFKQYIANNGGKVTPEDAVTKLTPVMNALTAVHRLGLIHRDVTPDNIFITKDGDVKLLDFGSAQYSLGEKSQTLDAILKPGYAPKEQYMRRSRQGPFTDVYSLGACFYASITGVLPPESLERNENDEMLTISEQGIAIDQNVENAIMTALAVNAQDRFQTMEDFKAAVVGEVAVTAPVRTETQVSAPRYSARNSEAAPQSAKKPGRALIAAIVGGVAVLAVVLVLVITLPKGGTAAQRDGTTGANSAGTAIAEGSKEQTANEDSAEPVETVTIAGQEFPVNNTGVSIPENTALTDEDIENILKLTELTKLNLSVQNLQNHTDISFISDFAKLETLNIYSEGNNHLPISDISVLENLTQLRQLRLSGTIVTDISAIANMTQLEMLELPNPVTDLEPIKNLTRLNSLRISNSSINGSPIAVDISALSNLTEMTQLRIASFNANDLTPLKGMTKLTYLEINIGAIGDISALTGMTELTTLMINSYSGSGNNAIGIYDLSPLKNMTKLETLNLYPHTSSDLSPLKGLVNLTKLNIRVEKNEPVHDISALSGMTKLRDLEIQFYNTNGPSVVDLEPLRGLTELTQLEVRAGVNNIEPLSNLTKLESLNLYYNYGYRESPSITDLTPLVKLINLKTLDLARQSKLQDVSPLAGLSQIVSVSLSGTAVTDVSALSKLSNLQFVDLTDCPITDWSPVDHVPNVTGRP